MPIQILPPQLANQIAAGEVVERPASVVKELVENSLDAGATKIEIEVDKGGSKLIRIRDNGQGIPKEELALALSRHATSKVHTLDDLEAILSFGFRGEALASISSVSRLTLTSKTAQQTQAWQAFAEGSQMDVKVTPAAHPQGSTIEVVDLFFNTPARRRFLKSDKTEFTHIDEWLKRIAAIRTDIHFSLSNNGKLVRQYRPANTQIQLQQRLAQICGRSFAEQALVIDCEHDGLKLSGYIQSPHDASVSDSSYFYVNGRLVRDRLVNHAVKQAFAEHQWHQQPAYVLKLELDPHQVDVNVHPAKHEVRFHQSRYVHDYILQALQSALSQIPAVENEALATDAYSHEPSENEPDDGVVESYEYDQSTGQKRQHVSQAVTSERGHLASFPRPSSSISASPYGRISAGTNQGTNYSGGRSAYGGKDKISDRAIQSYGQLLATPAIVNSGEQDLSEQYSSAHKASQPHTAQLPAMPALLADKFWVFAQGEALKLLELKSVGFHIKKQEINDKLATGLVSQPLLMPVSVKADKPWSETLVQREALLRQLGLDLTIRYQQLIIKKVPPYLRDSQLAVLIPQLLQWIERQVPEQAALAAWLAKNGQHEQSLTGLWQAFCLLSESEQQTLLEATPRLPWQDWLKESHSE
jgi:DNA mismatch repair protein MutL